VLWPDLVEPFFSVIDCQVLGRGGLPGLIFTDETGRLSLPGSERSSPLQNEARPARPSTSPPLFL